MAVSGVNGGAIPLSPNFIINGAFDIWQRGTSFDGSANSFAADRWFINNNGSGATRTVSRQTFTPGSAPEVGYEGQFFFRYNQSVAGSSGTFNVFQQKIEDVRVLAGQTATVSFWARAGSALTLPSVRIVQDFGTGGSSATITNAVLSQAITTSWTRYSYTVLVPSLAGKTIGSSNGLTLEFGLPLNSVFTLDIWGVQLEAGLAATPFRRNANNLQAELAACQRYYWRFDSLGASGNFMPFAMGHAIDSNSCRAIIRYPVAMRRLPTLAFSAASTFQRSFGNPMTSVVGAEIGLEVASVQWGRSGEFSANQGILITAANTQAAHIVFDSEL